MPTPWHKRFNQQRFTEKDGLLWSPGILGSARGTVTHKVTSAGWLEQHGAETLKAAQRPGLLKRSWWGREAGWERRVLDRSPRPEGPGWWRGREVFASSFAS